ncbi:YbjN domain-containing protein [Thermodesulfitimonas autotrophica]|uniref:YbjN domain-containing protein n=1 Tax=Thermodesulfitimonas autotrophica TaxID=1894989 RepID=UPI002FDF89E0
MFGRMHDLRRLFDLSREQAGLRSQLAGAVAEFLEAEGLKYHRPKDNVFMVPVATDAGAWQVIIHADEQRSFLVVLSSLPVRAGTARRAETAALLNRLNWKVAIGNFEMDPADGEIRYRTAVDVEHAPEAALPLMKHLFGHNVTTVARHWQVLVSFLTSDGMSAEEAARQLT